MLCRFCFCATFGQTKPLYRTSFIPWRQVHLSQANTLEIAQGKRRYTWRRQSNRLLALAWSYGLPPVFAGAAAANSCACVANSDIRGKQSESLRQHGPRKRPAGLPSFRAHGRSGPAMRPARGSERMCDDPARKQKRRSCRYPVHRR